MNIVFDYRKRMNILTEEGKRLRNRVKENGRLVNGGSEINCENVKWISVEVCIF